MTKHKPGQSLLKDYSKYCRKCALAKYNITSEMVKLFGTKPGPLRKEEFDNLVELRKALEAIDQEAAAKGFEKFQNEEFVNDVIES